MRPWGAGDHRKAQGTAPHIPFVHNVIHSNRPLKTRRIEASNMYTGGVRYKAAGEGALTPYDPALTPYLTPLKSPGRGPA